MTTELMLRLCAWAFGGLLLGAASFASLRLNTDLYVRGAAWRPICLHLLRLAVVAAALTVAALQSAGPLLALAGGVVAARPIAVRILGRAR